MYEYVDKVLKRLVRATQVLFRQYRRLPFDELNVLTTTEELYQQLNDQVVTAFLSIFDFYYRRENPAVQTTNLPVEAWLDGVLRQPSKVMKYAYTSEVTRKRDRLIEALIASNGDPQEIDKAMRYWAQMFGWFAVEVADAAVEQAREDLDIDLVEWKTARDGHVCAECAARDGVRYHLRQVPPKPHPNCRCYTVVVKE